MLARSISVLPSLRSRVVSDLLQRLVDEALMRLGIDLRSEQPLGRGNHEVGHLGTQVLDGTVTLAGYLAARALDQRLGVGPRLGEHFRGIRCRLLVCAIQDLACLGARL